MHVTPEFRVRVKWLETDGPLPLPATATVEVSQLLPHALIEFAVDVPEEMGYNTETLQYVLRIVLPCHRPGVPVSESGWQFEVWFSLEDQGWFTGEFDWTDSAYEDSWKLPPPWPLDDLSDSLYNEDEEGVFDAFTRLRGGQIEFVGWLGNVREPT